MKAPAQESIATASPQPAPASVTTPEPSASHSITWSDPQRTFDIHHGFKVSIAAKAMPTISPYDDPPTNSAFLPSASQTTASPSSTSPSTGPSHLADLALQFSAYSAYYQRSQSGGGWDSSFESAPTASPSSSQPSPNNSTPSLQARDDAAPMTTASASTTTASADEWDGISRYFSDGVSRTSIMTAAENEKSKAKRDEDPDEWTWTRKPSKIWGDWPIRSVPTTVTATVTFVPTIVNTYITYLPTPSPTTLNDYRELPPMRPPPNFEPPPPYSPDPDPFDPYDPQPKPKPYDPYDPYDPDDPAEATLTLEPTSSWGRYDPASPLANLDLNLNPTITASPALAPRSDLWHPKHHHHHHSSNPNQKVWGDWPIRSVTITQYTYPRVSISVTRTKWRTDTWREPQYITVTERPEPLPTPFPSPDDGQDDGRDADGPAIPDLPDEGNFYPPAYNPHSPGDYEPPWDDDGPERETLTLEPTERWEYYTTEYAGVAAAGAEPPAPTGV